MANDQSVRRHLDAFTRGRIIWEVGVKGLQSSELLTSSFHDALETISNYRNSYPGSVVVVHEGTTRADDRYIVLQARRNRRQTARRNRYTHDTGDWTTDIAFYRGQKDCTVVVCLHDTLYGVYL
ncbi:hypothetical protein TNCV_3852751 [Trichonephila clavipes]|nr:hypothetical protein TNCV_3852751 [Trichonephila clavipes]